jgi:hypothetical protein
MQISCHNNNNFNWHENQTSKHYETFISVLTIPNSVSLWKKSKIWKKNGDVGESKKLKKNKIK